MTVAETKARPGAKGPAGLASEVWELLSELAFSNRPRFMALCRELELFPPQLMVLKALEKPKPMNEVAALLACDNSNMTGIIDRLEERDLVHRTTSPHDRRVKLLVLTEEGRRVRSLIVERMSEPPPELAVLSASDLRTLRDILQPTNAT